MSKTNLTKYDIITLAHEAGFVDAGDTGLWISDGYWDVAMVRLLNSRFSITMCELDIWKTIACEEMGEDNAMAEFKHRSAKLNKLAE